MGILEEKLFARRGVASCVRMFVGMLVHTFNAFTVRVE